MKRSRRIFSMLGIAIWAVSAPASTIAQVPTAAGVQASPDDSQAEQLIAKALQAVDQPESLTAKVRNQVDLYDRHVSGEGQYFQQGRAAERRTRFEMCARSARPRRPYCKFATVAISGRFAICPADVRSIASICSGVRTAFEPGGRNPTLPPAMLAAGGLPKLLADLAHCFHFERLRAGRIGDEAVWMVEGQWRPGPLALAAPDLRGAIESGRQIDWAKLPGHLPDRVIVCVGQQDLMPARIEYLCRTSKWEGAGQGGSLAGYRLMLLLTFFEMHVNPAIDPRQFVLQSGGTTVSDATDAYLKNLTAEATAPSRRSSCETSASAAAANCQRRRNADRFDHAARLSPALPSQIECRSVSDASSHNRQAQRDVYRAMHAKQLERYVSLIVIHGHHGVELAVASAHH